jgi:3-(3-hydroxy-phenyl)propionate hydroxylase
MAQLAPPSLLQSYHDERHEAAVENVKVTNRTARYLRPADGVERVFRTATIALAKKQLFARSLINTGRMAIANPYTRSKLCSKDAGVSVQNVEFQWVDGTAGNMNDLLRWASSHLLLLVFGKLSKREIIYLQALAGINGLRVAQVLAVGTEADITEALRDHFGQLKTACKIGNKYVAQTGWALIRPDNYLAAHGTAIDADLINALQFAQGIAL